MKLSVVVPTFCECENVPLLVGRLAAVLDPVLGADGWEVVFVDDDSGDGTAEVVHGLALKDRRVRGILRVGRRGLAGACVEGMLAASGDFVAVMDADLQHDEKILPQMLGILERHEADVVVGSRYVEGGSAESFEGLRGVVSRFSGWLARVLLRVEVRDPMSGFFMLRRSALLGVVRRLSSQGFKILLDILASGRGGLRVVEVPYVFGSRLHGESKLDSLVMMDFLGLLVAKLTYDVVPVRFLLFSMIGAFGVLVHLLALKVALTAGLMFALAQAAATVTAMTSNFWLNNRLTYRAQRLRGLGFVRGLLLAYAAWSFGAFANVGVAQWIYDHDSSWWLAGLAGALVGSVWNYVVAGVLIWRR